MLQIIRGRHPEEGQDQPSIYLIRIVLTPRTRWGQLFFHIFLRGDIDPDPHDHPWDFWTFPLGRYTEEVVNPMGQVYRNVVRPLHWHHRSATYIHRVLPRRDGSTFPWCTIVWHGPYKRHWGFWVQETWPGSEPRRLWVYWKHYLGVK